jgi:uncharacterized protein (DUF1501 family)
MTKFHPIGASRRRFLRTAGALSALGAGSPLALSLAGIGAAAAQTAADDYRALVCVFMFGGNDQSNTVIPFDGAEFASYQGARSSIARSAEDCTPLGAVASQGGRSFALPKELAPLATLYAQGKAAIVANVGPLFVPATKAQVQANSVPLPPKLYSHNDQQSVWQSSNAEGATVGWGGRFADLLASANASQTFTSVSVAGNAVFLSGRNVLQYQVGSGGPITISALSGSPFGSNLAAAALRQLVTAGSPNVFEDELNKVHSRAITANESLSAALQSAPPLATTFAADVPLAQQLRMVARMISARHALGVRRQVFFVSIGGFDNHDSLLATLPTLHARVAGAIESFHAATVELGVADRVTTFTASDFGRTLTSNGDGSDHGWGAHHFVVGDAVRGGSIYGTFPTVALGTAEDLGAGRLLPTTSVTQFSATLATWFGVPAGSLADVLPYIGNFTVSDLGFMA